MAHLRTLRSVHRGENPRLSVWCKQLRYVTKQYPWHCSPCPLRLPLAHLFQAPNSLFNTETYLTYHVIFSLPTHQSNHQPQPLVSKPGSSKRRENRAQVGSRFVFTFCIYCIAIGLRYRDTGTYVLMYSLRPPAVLPFWSERSMILLMMSLLSHTTLASLSRTRYLSPCTNDQSPAIFAMCTIRLCKSASKKGGLTRCYASQRMEFLLGEAKSGPGNLPDALWVVP